MNCPTIYNVDDLRNLDAFAFINNQLVTARPFGWQGFNVFYRLRCAWKVFSGKADVLEWTGDQQPKAY